MELHSHADIRNRAILWRGHWTTWPLMEFTDGWRHNTWAVSQHLLIQYVMQLSALLHLFISQLMIQMDRDLLWGLVLGRQKEMFCLTSVSEETKISVCERLGVTGEKRRAIFWLQQNLSVTSRKHVRNLIWEGEPKILDVKNLAEGPSHLLAELCAAREGTFRNMVRITNKLPRPRGVWMVRFCLRSHAGVEVNTLLPKLPIEFRTMELKLKIPQMDGNSCPGVCIGVICTSQLTRPSEPQDHWNTVGMRSQGKRSCF